MLSRHTSALVAALSALWKGELPLSQAFWEYAIAYGTIANIAATVAAIAAATAGLPDVVAIAIFLLPLPYILVAVIGIVRSANRYQWPRHWAGMAKVAVIVWGAATRRPKDFVDQCNGRSERRPSSRHPITNDRKEQGTKQHHNQDCCQQTRYVGLSSSGVRFLFRVHAR